MEKFINAMNRETNTKRTENGAVASKSTLNDVYDLFALGGAYRERTDEDCVLLFKNAYEQDKLLALKCLFYLRDIRGGQGERRFFRVCMKWLAENDPFVLANNIANIPEYGRYDDLYSLVGTKNEEAMWSYIKTVLDADLKSEGTVSLLGKWLKSENTSSPESCELGKKTRKALGMNSKKYRKMLSDLRERIKVLERLMSANRWDDIEFDKIPSKAGMKYSNAFARRDILKARYERFMTSDDTTVNAGALYPYDVVHRAITNVERSWSSLDDFDYSTGSFAYHYRYKGNDIERAVCNKYWDSLSDYLNSGVLNAIALVDVSGSMSGTPMEVAISLGLYCAEKVKGPFNEYFLSFESKPHWIRVEGNDFCDKVARAMSAPWGGSTNLSAAFDLLLDAAVKNRCAQSDIPENLIIISDMEIDEACEIEFGRSTELELERIRFKWESAGYAMPKLIFWNVNARHDTFLDSPDATYVSGMSSALFEQIMHGTTGIDLMLEKLNSDRYQAIKL